MSSCEDYISRFKRTFSAIKHQQVLSSREKKKSELSIQAMAQKVVNVTNYLEPFVNRLSSNVIDQKLLRNLVGK